VVPCSELENPLSFFIDKTPAFDSGGVVRPISEAGLIRRRVISA
jgi:hypothetical protein